MKNAIPRSPEKLAVFLGNLLAGDDKHLADKPLPSEVRVSIEATKKTLESLNVRVQTSTGEVRQATQDRREFMNKAVDLAERYRAQVVALHGAKGAALVDYALFTRKEREKAVAVCDTPEVRKAADKLLNAQIRLINLNAEFERAQARLARAKTILTLREAGLTAATSTADGLALPVAPVDSSTPPFEAHQASETPRSQ